MWTKTLYLEVKLPLECPLHPFRDLFKPQQDAKKRERPSQWTCRLCGKSFFEETFIDKHFENRHNEFINKAEDAVCIADFCDLLRCEVFLSQDFNLINNDLYGATDIEVWSDHSSSSSLSHSHISSSSMPRQSNMRQFLQIRKKNVLSIATAIAGTNAQSISGIQFHTNNFCRDQNLKSSSQNKNNKNNHDENIPDCENKSEQEIFENNNEHENSQTDQTINIQRMKYDCKPEKLSKLKEKCEFLIRTCIMGLLFEMSDYDFREMEEELNKAVCWYLTCERYWEDGPLEPKAFPWGLILVLIMVLSLGICFCYYIIWILFDTDETINNQTLQTLGRYSPSRYSPGIIQQKHQQRGILQRSTKIDTVGSGLLSLINPIQDIKDENYPHLDEISIQPPSDTSDLAQNEHYIYVTYPPELKRRLLEKYE